MKIATLGGGCFWCTEGIFKHIEGVEKVLPGYMGGARENPTYEQVCSGATGHAEVIQVTYDENKIDYEELLKVFFRTHNPTTLNRQGNDIGTQYRSVVFYHDEEQKLAAENIIQLMTEHEVWEDPIVTEVTTASTFWEAEEYHHNYFERNPQNAYCAAVVAPKIAHFLKTYEKLKKEG